MGTAGGVYVVRGGGAPLVQLGDNDCILLPPPPPQRWPSPGSLIATLQQTRSDKHGPFLQWLHQAHRGHCSHLVLESLCKWSPSETFGWGAMDLPGGGRGSNGRCVRSRCAEAAAG